ncbi:MAG: polysaccharide biosynthesis/export family protein [Pseudomonadota bacterium]
MNKSVASVALGLTLSMSGCAFIPGTHLYYDDEDVVAPAADTPTELPVAVYPITPAIIAEQPAPPAPSSPESNLELADALARYEYRVGLGDVLMVSVWDHPEFSLSVSTGVVSTAAGNSNLSALAPATAATAPMPETPTSTRASGVQVQRDGTIFLAYAGKLNVAGKSVPAIRDQITRALSKYIQKPQVDVAVQSFNSQRVYLTGDIGKSGVLPLTTEPLTLFDAVTRIGLAPTPDLETVVLVRNGERRNFSLERLFKLGDASQNVLLRQGDVLNFSRNLDRVVFVLGEVGSSSQGTAGRVNIGADGLTLAAALAQAGGLNQLTAKATGVFVMRGVVDAEGKRSIKVFQLDASNATAYILADQFKLQQRDFVYVTAAPVVRFNRVMSQIVPFASSFLIYNNF